MTYRYHQMRLCKNRLSTQLDSQHEEAEKIYAVKLRIAVLSPKMKFRYLGGNCKLIYKFIKAVDRELREFLSAIFQKVKFKSNGVHIEYLIPVLRQSVMDHHLNRMSPKQLK